MLPPSVMRYDLQLHATVGAWLSIPLYILPHFTFGWSKGIAALVCIISIFLITVYKELRDTKKPGGFFDWLDIAAGMGGTIVPMLLMIIFR